MHSNLESESKVQRSIFRFFFGNFRNLRFFSGIPKDEKSPELQTYGAVHMPTAHMSTDGCEALSAH